MQEVVAQGRKERIKILLAKASATMLEQVENVVTELTQQEKSEREIEDSVEQLLTREGVHSSSQGEESLIKEGLKRIKAYDGKRNFAGWAKEFERLTAGAISRSGMISLALQYMSDEATISFGEPGLNRK